MGYKIQRYGWKPDVPDQRDLKFAAPPKVLKALPPGIDLRATMPPIVDQGNLGSCTANTTCSMVHFVAIKEADDPIFAPSRLFQYYNTRMLEGTVREDSGASIRNSIKAMVKWGFCPENIWDYDIKKFKRKPIAKAYKVGRRHLVRQYHRVPQNIEQMKAVLASGLPIAIGFAVYDSFESKDVEKTGIVPMPGAHEQLQGGHAVLVSGYNDAAKWFIFRNSWGTGWGDQGYGYIPYDFLNNRDLASDFWTINSAP